MIERFYTEEIKEIPEYKDSYFYFLSPLSYIEGRKLADKTTPHRVSIYADSHFAALVSDRAYFMLRAD